MRLQFLYNINPNIPDQGEYIEHYRFPRFLAKIENNDLVIIEKFDGEDADYEGKLNRAREWYYSIKDKINRKNN